MAPGLAGLARLRHHKPDVTMIEGQASHTAYRVALRRAAHQLLDQPKVLDDPVALRIIGREAAAALDANPRHYETTLVAPYLRAFMAVRSRCAEDELALAVKRGVTQYVVLGAGLDTFAYRNSFPTLRVFEVDHPSTQAWKRTQLAENDIPIPDSLRFVPVDFASQTIEDRLPAEGFDTKAPAFFSWLGVTMYLQPERVLETLRYIASFPVGGGVVFDYAVPRSSLGFFQKRIFDRMAQSVEAAGEPWIGFFDPAQLAADLRAMGYSYVEDLGGDEINEKYFANREDGLMVGSLAHLMVARHG